MNFFNRALTSIRRRPGKTIILLVLIFVLSNVIAGSISVKNALANTENAMLEQMGVEVTIQVDWETIYSDPNGKYTVPPITADIVESIGQSEYIRSFDYSISQWFEGRGMKYYYSEDPGYDYGNAYFGLTGGQNTEHKYIKSGDIILKEGRVYTQEEIDSGAKVILISDKLAQVNGLNVGSTVTFLYTIYNYSGNIVYKDAAVNSSDISILPADPNVVKTLEFEFKVIGIFNAPSIKTTDKDGKVVEEDSPYLNTIFTDNKAIASCNDTIKAEMAAAGLEDNTYTDANAVFILKSPDVVDIFESQNQQYLPKGLMFTDNAESFDSIRTPMANVKWIADIVMWVAVCATILIISLLVTLFLRDRKHEMGIYLALGERKGIIAAQILSEVLIIAIVAVSLSLYSGNILAQKMSTTMLKNQLAEQQKNNADDDIIIYREISSIYYGDETQTGISTDEVMEMYSVSLDAKTVAFIYLIGMGSVIVSTLIPIAYTLRLKPKNILM